jgi:hypothetical protein
MKQRKKILRVLWLAIQDAKDYEDSIVDAWSGNKKEAAVKSATKNIADLNELQKMIFGNQRSIRDRFLSGEGNPKTIDIFALLQNKEIPK